MRIVVALGGNALLRRGEPADAEAQERNVEVAARGISELAGEHQVIVTHGNGPQVGLLALMSESYHDVKPYPLDVLGAESEGMIGYLLEIAIRNAAPDRAVATVLTEVLVDSDDHAFAEPSKPIGPVYTREQAERLARERGWTVRADGDAYRRVVPSPEPLGRVELVQIVDHEHEPPLERFQVGEQALDQRLAAEFRRRGDPLGQLLAVRIGKRVYHREPEVLGVVFAALDRNPGDPLVEARRLSPGAEQHRLAAAGGAADERHPARGDGREPFEQRLALDQPDPNWEALLLGLTRCG
jgi:hypothetical protein